MLYKSFLGKFFEINYFPARFRQSFENNNTRYSKHYTNALRLARNNRAYIAINPSDHNYYYTVLYVTQRRMRLFDRHNACNKQYNLSIDRLQARKENDRTHSTRCSSCTIIRWKSNEYCYNVQRLLTLYNTLLNSNGYNWLSRKQPCINKSCRSV